MAALCTGCARLEVMFSVYQAFSEPAQIKSNKMVCFPVAPKKTSWLSCLLSSSVLSLTPAPPSPSRSPSRGLLFPRPLLVMEDLASSLRYPLSSLFRLHWGGGSSVQWLRCTTRVTCASLTTKTGPAGSKWLMTGLAYCLKISCNALWKDAPFGAASSLLLLLISTAVLVGLAFLQQHLQAELVVFFFNSSHCLKSLTCLLNKEVGSIIDRINYANVPESIRSFEFNCCWTASIFLNYGWEGDVEFPSPFASLFLRS